MTNPNTSLIEAIARGLARWEEGHERRWCDYATQAHYALSAIQSSGMVVVPVEPTDNMILAACNATFGPRPLTPERAHATGYRAMLQASPHSSMKEETVSE